MKKKFSMERNVAIAGILLVMPSIISISLFIVKPLLDSFIMSFKKIDFLSSDPETFVGFKNFSWLVNEDWFSTVLFNTFMIAILVTIIQVILAIFVALLIDFDFPGKKILRSIIISPWAIPVFVAALMWRWLCSSNMSPLGDFMTAIGLMESGKSILSNPVLAFWALVIALVWHGFPFIFLVVYSGLQQVPNSVKEAAYIDGANSFQVAMRVTIPTIRSVIATVSILRFVFVFNQFPFIHLMTNGGPLQATKTLAVAAMNQGINSYRYGRASAITTLLFVMLLIMFVLYYTVSGKKEFK